MSHDKFEYHHGEVDLISETDQDDIAYAREKKYDEAIFIEDSNTVIIHDIKSGYTNRCQLSDDEHIVNVLSYYREYHD